LKKVILKLLFQVDAVAMFELLSVAYSGCMWCVGHITVGGHDRRIPSLSEVFEQFPEVPINIDIKVDNDELIRKVCCMPV